MSAYQPRTTPSYSYDSAYASLQSKGMPIFAYDASADWCTALNLEASAGNVAKFRQFTGKERDTESGLDYFGARYYGSALGRFSSPDPAGIFVADLSNPQSWNLYGYVWNNPLGNLDPTGLSCVNLDNGGQSDDGDGKGCAGAGVKPGNADDPSTLNQGQTNAQANAENPPDLQLASVPITATLNFDTTPPPRRGTSICAGYGTVCFPTTAPNIEPIDWSSVAMYAACIANVESGFMVRHNGNTQAQDASDTVPATQGTRRLPSGESANVFFGPGRGLQNGGQAPVNPGGDSPVPGTVADGANYFSNVLQCIANVRNNF